MKNNNDSFPLFFMLFMWVFMLIVIFDDDDKKPAYTEDAIEYSADTNSITAQELVDQKKVDRVITFTPDTEETISKKWDSLLITELVSNRPVYYRGDGNISHAWICDGISESNMCNLNFGWGGYMNGLLSSNVDRHAVVTSKSLGSSKTKVTDTSSFTIPSGYFRGSMSGSELNRLYNAILSANSPGAKMIAYMTEMDKLNKEQEELAKDMDNPPLSAYQEALLYGNIACYIQKNYLPINSVILDIYKDRLSRD